jgi:hypothetical protein
VTEPLPEPSDVPASGYRLPQEVVARIRATAPPARGTRRRRTVMVPAICIFGSGARLGDAGGSGGDRPTS